MNSLSVDVHGRVARLGLRSAGEPLERPFLEALLAACDEIARRDDVSVVLLTGNASAFAAEWSLELLREAAELPLRGCGALADLPQPVVVALSGEVRSADIDVFLGRRGDGRDGFPVPVLHR